MLLPQTLAFEIYYIELWHIFSILFIIIINFYIYLNARKSSLLYSYLIVEGLLFIWLLSKIFKTVSPTSDIRWFFIVTQYFGNCFLGSSFFTFAHIYAKGKLPGKKLIILTHLTSLFFFLAVCTNPWHMLFYSYYDYYRDSFGPLFYLNQFYTYSIMLVGLYLCAKQFFWEFHHKRIQALILSFAVVIPFLVNIFYIFKLFKLIFGFRPLFDITPITCNISLILFVIGTFKYSFFDIITIAWRKVFNQIPEGVILFNNDLAITDINFTSETTFETSELIKATLDKATLDDSFEFMYTSSTGKHFKISWTPFYRKYRNKGHILRFIDDTSYQKTLQTLSDKNQALMNFNEILSIQARTKQTLSIYKTRNFMGREIHDVLGHSIVLTLSILEVAKLSLKNDFMTATEKFSQAIWVMKNATHQMDNTLLNPFKTNVSTMNNLILEIKKLVHETSLLGQTIHLTIQVNDNSNEIPKPIGESVFRLCQEAITNAIRHGKAEKIDIILRFYSLQLEIYIIDNGLGCSKIKKGYGLIGMEERIVEDLGGELNYGSLEGGFTVKATVPLGAN